MIKISEKYAIDFDTRNIILQEMFEKREGKGKYAPLSGEFGYRDLTFHGSLRSLVDSLVEYDLRKEEVDSLTAVVDRIEALKVEIETILSEKIVLPSKEKGD